MKYDYECTHQNVGHQKCNPATAYYFSNIMIQVWKCIIMPYKSNCLHDKFALKSTL